MASHIASDDIAANRAVHAHNDRMTISFEVFPPRDKSSEDRLLRDLRSLESLSPRFVSVTYGAGGSTQENTRATAARIAAETVITPAAHLTCIDASQEEIDAVARDYWKSGIRHIVAVRGDPPGHTTAYHPHPRGYAYAADLVVGLRRIANFEISVAAYPEVHPEASSASQDLIALKRKIDAGATRAITQFFFDPEVFLRFVERAQAAGINVPIVAGIMPIANFERVRKFARRCGVTIPAALADLFDERQEDPHTRHRLAVATAEDLCRQLLEHGQRDFHFYTLNDARLATAICNALRGSHPSNVK